MKVGGVSQANLVRSFVKNNVARIEIPERAGKKSSEIICAQTPSSTVIVGDNIDQNTILNILGHPAKNKPSTKGTPMYLYGKNDEYLGELHHDSYVGGHMRCTLIMGEDLKPKMQEIVCVQRGEVYIHPQTEEELYNTKKLPTKITTTTTVVDHDNDRFVTTRKVRKLVNELEEVTPDDPNCVMYGAYKPIEKPRYIEEEEVINEGSISKVKNSIMPTEIAGRRPHRPHWEMPIDRTTIPGMFWYRSGKSGKVGKS